MNRATVHRQIEALGPPVLARDEQLRASAPVWAVEQRGRVPLLFRARQLYFVALTDQRLVLLRAPTRRQPLSTDSVVMAKRYPSFTVTRRRRIGPILQLRLRTSDDRVLVLEFRSRDHKTGRELEGRILG
jgi:hypothetical protein